MAVLDLSVINNGFFESSTCSLWQHSCLVDSFSTMLIFSQ